MTETLRNMPKIDLHCHLDGSLSRTCIETLLGKSVDPHMLEADPHCRNLAEYLVKFDIPLQCLRTAEGLEAGAYDFMRTISSDRICYVEVRFAPLLSVNTDLNARDVIESVLKGLDRGKREFGIEYGVIICAMRHMGEEENTGILKLAREYLGSGVCAADLAGNEAAFPMAQFTNLFSQVKRWGMPFTIHAGECGSAENIKEAAACGAARIGHGIAMSGRTDVMEICREKRIGIEMCPISNMQTKAVQDIAAYPMKEFIQNGLLVTLNTDNRTVSHTSIEKEIQFIQDHFSISDEQVVGMMKNAVESAFAPDSVKHSLLQKFRYNHLECIQEYENYLGGNT